jgi:hypothetical protein
MVHDVFVSTKWVSAESESQENKKEAVALLYHTEELKRGVRGQF